MPTTGFWSAIEAVRSKPQLTIWQKLLTASGGQRQVNQWIGVARTFNRRADLEAVLLLITEAVMGIWRTDDPVHSGQLAPYMGPFRRLHVELKGMDASTPFLKAWYLLWESFRHVHATYPFPKELDFMPAALAAFPNDARVLLAAGSRHELYWWLSFEIARRDVAPAPFAVTQSLTIARGFLRRKPGG
jgi:hypothetical protein